MSVAKVRQSQVISAYGPGALVDLPDCAVLVAGLDHWQGKEVASVSEPRLLANLRQRLGKPELELRSPPVPEDEEAFPQVGVVAFQFPEWYVAQYEVVSKAYGQSRPLVHRRKLSNGRYLGEDASGKRKSKPYPVVPVRFVQACPNGHVSDIDWPRVVHGSEKGCVGQLWLDERGTTGDLSELFVRCDCGRVPPVPLMRLQAGGEDGPVLGECRGERPWLGPKALEACKGKEGKAQRNRLLVRHASNAYFPVIERAISIPDAGAELARAVDAVWTDFLSVAESAADVRRERKKARVSQALAGFSDEDVWVECRRRMMGGEEEQRKLKDVELETFMGAPDSLGEDLPEGDFYARRLNLGMERKGAMGMVERVVLVHRLREVAAQVGFTRFEAQAPQVESEMDLGVGLAALALEANWLPAVENRGEGVFVGLDTKRVEAWLKWPAVEVRAKAFCEGIGKLLKKPVTQARVERIYMPYMMLHTLSHLLLTAISLECGYAAASIKERIYVGKGGYGILLYTGTPDAEGTLGGLVQTGHGLGRHLENALSLGRLCSNDPVCAQHSPDRLHEGRMTQGAACHGCLLIAEPSCEQRNELLDRALVVPVVGYGDAAFFRGEKA